MRSTVGTNATVGGADLNKQEKILDALRKRLKEELANIERVSTSP
jgi:vacuolar-type H+-ATPase subunit E/Vma4